MKEKPTIRCDACLGILSDINAHAYYLHLISMINVNAKRGYSNPFPDNDFDFCSYECLEEWANKKGVIKR